MDEIVDPFTSAVIVGALVDRCNSSGLDIPAELVLDSRRFSSILLPSTLLPAGGGLGVWEGRCVCVKWEAEGSAGTIENFRRRSEAWMGGVLGGVSPISLKRFANDSLLFPAKAIALLTRLFLLPPAPGCLIGVSVGVGAGHDSSFCSRWEGVVEEQVANSTGLALSGE